MADDSRNSQSVVLVAAASTAPTRDSQSLVLAAAAVPSAARDSQSALLAVAATIAVARVSQTVVLVVREPPVPARDSQSLILTAGAVAGVPRVSQSLVLLARETPAPARNTQSVVLIVGANTDGGGGGASAIRDSQSLVLVAGDASKPRVSQSVVLVASIAACGNDCGLTLGDLRDRALSLVGEATEFPVYWSAAEMERLVNDAYRAMARDTKALREIFEITVVDGTEEYTLDERVMQVNGVYLDERMLRNTTVIETRTPASGAVWGYIVSLEDEGKIRLVDTPEAGGDLTVWATVSPEPLSHRCDVPLLPAWSHQGLAFGAAGRALAKYGEMRSEAVSGAYRAIYEDYRSLLAGQMAATAPERLAGMR